MKVTIENCNNIDFADIKIERKKFNIKFAANGTGKSTIATAIINRVDENKLGELLPFKAKVSGGSEVIPKISIDETLEHVMCFNEDYVDQYVFKEKELLVGSYDIFIRDKKFKLAEESCQKIIEDIRKSLLENDELEGLIDNLKALVKAFKPTKTGVSKASTGMKGLSSGNNLKHISPTLTVYRPFIESDKATRWVDWQTQGVKDFHELSDMCPFCGIDKCDQTETIQDVGNEYDAKTVKNLVAVLNVLDSLGDYFSEETKSNLLQIAENPESVSQESEQYFKHVVEDTNLLIEKLEKVRAFSGFDFQNTDELNTMLRGYKIDLDMISHLNSDKTQGAIAPVNDSVDGALQQAGILKGAINRQRLRMTELIAIHEQGINNFLKYAGYSYQVAIVGKDDDAQLRLKHLDDTEKYVSGGRQHLSFGERNAFAIILFMYECLSKEPDLIILDDPISSFDKNKKFAILNMLLKNETYNLMNKTVLMLTHDVEPIIDTVRSVSKQYSNVVSASFLKMDDGKITETSIEKGDIKTFAQVCISKVQESDCQITKLIYLRRYHEVLDDKSDAYEVLSNLFHKRNKDEAQDHREWNGDTPSNLSGAKLEGGINGIRVHVSDFDYDQSVQDMSCKDTLKSIYDNCTNGYEKLQVFRLIEPDFNNPAIRKFINESYHIENEYVCQLDPEKFDTVPEYVISICDQYVGSIE